MSDTSDADLTSTARFWDRIAERYARKAVPDEAVYARKLALLRERLGPGMRMVEVGCGTGTTAVALAASVASVRAADISGAMIAIAERRAREAQCDNVRFEVSSVERLAVAPGSVDVVCAHSLLHLLPDPASALQRLRGWLSPGGLLVTSTPCLSEVAGWLRVVEPIAAGLGLMPKLTFFDRPELEAWFDAAALRVEHRWQPSPRQGVFHIARAV